MIRRNEADDRSQQRVNSPGEAQVLSLLLLPHEGTKGAAGHSLYSVTGGNGEQVEAIRTNEDQLGTDGGRTSPLTHKGAGFQNKSVSHADNERN